MKRDYLRAPKPKPQHEVVIEAERQQVLSMKPRKGQRYECPLGHRGLTAYVTVLSATCGCGRLMRRVGKRQTAQKGDWNPAPLLA
jgi:hypothetical protein